MVEDKGIIGKIRNWLFGARLEKPCANCEMLQEQLSFANYDRKMLLEHFIRAAMPKNEEAKLPLEIDELQPIRLGAKQSIPWRVKQQQLESESKQRASMLRPNIPINAEPRPDAPRAITPESIAQLEKELGVSDALHE